MHDYGFGMVVDVLSFGEPLVGFYPPHGVSLTKAPSITKTWGGDTSNVAIGVTRLGKKSRYFTRVGDDPFGRGFLDLWNDNGVDTSAVMIDSQHATGLYFVSFEGNRHQLTYYRSGSAASCIGASDVSESLVRDCRILHVSGISIGMSESALSAGKELITISRSLGRKVSFDVNYRPAQWHSASVASTAIAAMIGGGVDVLEITDDEMDALGWGTDPFALWDKFPDCGIVILKKGVKGAIVMSRAETVTVPAFSVEVKDTVGAGDSFDAGFLCAQLEGKTLGESARFAAAAAALTCTGTGPLEKMPHRDVVDEFLKMNGILG
jgi:2-dehydro-3-deoxygluconokinase